MPFIAHGRFEWIFSVISWDLDIYCNILDVLLNRSDLFLVNFYDSIFADDIWTCEVQLHSFHEHGFHAFLR